MFLLMTLLVFRLTPKLTGGRRPSGLNARLSVQYFELHW
jgi:hypothetical protein